MRNFVLILFAMVFLVGCGNTLKNTWTNFRAYYNTYYNAKKHFNAGYKKIQDQPITVEPKQPVRIHPAPVQAGKSDFQKAIDKGAKLLRKFPSSRWADDAVLLIGKSYYYRQEFYPALQKFEELRNAGTSSHMEQLAIIWKARTLLDLDLYSDGVSFLRTELSLYPNSWSREKKAEIQALAGEHYAMLGNWEESASYLSKATADLENKDLLERTFFLYGQVLERLEQYSDAYFAYASVLEQYPNFEFVYWSRFKQADVARKGKNYSLAISIFEKLRKDDKNFERREELMFEIARTLEMQGKTAEAEERYKDLLYSDRRTGSQTQNLRADIYYRLGEMYSDQYNNYSVAAAYFDSSSTINDKLERIDATQEDAQTLAEVFGNYTRLKDTIQRADSLLTLGALSKTELDSVLKKIRAQKRRELTERRESQSQELLANRNLSDNDEQNATASSVHGFLNYRSDELVNQAKAEFRIIWGNRPLIDNWRRIKVVRQPNVSSNRSSLSEESNAPAAEEEMVVDMNLEEIPRTTTAKNEFRSEKVKAQFELGNLLFLNLNSPDRARRYFHRVIKSEMGKEIRPRAMYSLFELFNSSGNRDSLQYWGNQILREYPKTSYAQQVRSRLSDQPPVHTEPDSSQKLVRRFQQIVDSSRSNKAAKLRKLALANRSSDLAPRIYYRSIETYIEQAKDHDEYRATSDTTLGDTAITADSANMVTFSGAYWDSARFAVQEFDTTFPNAEQQKKVAKLRETLKKPASAQLPTCKELGISLNVKPSMDKFLSMITYPEKLKGTSLSGEVVYSFVVTGAGKVESYQLVSQKTSLGIEEAFEKAFDESLQFEPLQIEDPPPKIECEVSFPIQS